MWGKCSVMEKCIVSMGQNMMYLLIFMLSVLLSNGYNIPFIFIIKLSPTNGQVY